MRGNKIGYLCQFSIAPWQYDEEVVRISRKMTRLHEEHADLFISLAKHCVNTGEPIIRPLWYVYEYGNIGVLYYWK